MFKIAIVVFRECLEISLLLGVVLAATKPIVNSRYYVLLGLLIGGVISFLLTLCINYISISFNGLGDEIFNSSLIILTSLIISWTVVWMQGYSQKIRSDLSVLSDNISAGHSHHFMVTVIVAAAILREGMEIILFVYSIISVGRISNTEIIFGAASGVLIGLSVGAILYCGLIKYAGKYIFKISTIILILIAAGLAAEAAGILTSAGIIEVYSERLWDTSWLINNTSMLGSILNITVGYDAKPNGLQVIFYVVSILITLIMIKTKSLCNKTC
ncbi:MAG: FTR1 family protein [Rickettsiaceae bacterium]